MDERRFGDLGPTLSVIGLGCNNFGMKLDFAESAAVLSAALDAGVTHLDTAEVYGNGKSEEFIGKALGARRDEVVIATKFQPRPASQPFTPGILRKHIVDACEGSLRRLKTDRIDLYYQHFVDPAAATDEPLEALAHLMSQGKVLSIASSNVTQYDISAFDDCASTSSLPRFCGVQVEWNLLNRGVERDVVPAARDRGLGVIPFFPLASGMLTGKYRRGRAFPVGSRLATMPAFAEGVVSDANHDRVERLETFAQERGHSLGQLALAWLAAQPGVASVIAGATTPDQVHENVAAAHWALSAEEVAFVGD